jgi:hypothetical protein
MKISSTQFFLIATLLSSVHTILGMNNNGLSPMAKQLKKASVNEHGGQTYYNVSGFKKAFQDNASNISAADLYSAYVETKSALVALAQEYAICDRDYAAAFISFNKRYPGSFNPQLIQQCQWQTHAMCTGNQLQLHIAAHRWGECTCDEQATHNWPSIPKNNS